MDITPTKITIGELTEDYVNSQEFGVIGYGGRLDIRPQFQREYVYNEKQRDLVIDSILNEYPLSIMYWNTKEDGTFEILDGQQRTISICEYVANNFRYGKYFHSQPDDIQEKILNYKLDIYQCKGTHSEKLAWFRVINVAGVVLKPQELLNAIYAGTWLNVAKKWFSKTKCPANIIGGDFMKGSPIRQDYLETTLKWISAYKGYDGIEDYMGKHQHDKDANELWDYYESVIEFIKKTFVGNKRDIRKEMQSVDWGILFNEFGTKKLDPQAIQAEVTELMKDTKKDGGDITNPTGIYSYVLTRDEKHLNIRLFNKREKTKTYERQDGKCANCEKEFPLNKMEANHKKQWADGGKTDIDNCEMLCVECHKAETKRQAKARAQARA